MTEREKEQKLIEYEPLIKSMANKIFLDGYDFDDIVQELSMVLLIALDKYDGEKYATTFKTFFIMLQRNWLYAKINHQNVEKRPTLLAILDSPISINQTNHSNVDYLECERPTPEQLDKREEMELFIERFLDEHRYGRLVRQRFLEGKTNVELSSEYGVTHQALSVRVKNTLKELKQRLQEEKYI